ncbi:MAG: hypothetical protein AAF194_01265 [Pseudomonadota bacterium]
MKKLIATVLGVALSAGAVSAFASKEDRQNLTQCKADVESYYGDKTRVRLRSIKRSAGETHLRLMVNPKGGENTVVVCSVARDGATSLADREGVALAPITDEQKVSLVN